MGADDDARKRGGGGLGRVQSRREGGETERGRERREERARERGKKRWVGGGGGVGVETRPTAIPSDSRPYPGGPAATLNSGGPAEGSSPAGRRAVSAAGARVVWLCVCVVWGGGGCCRRRTAEPPAAATEERRRTRTGAESVSTAARGTSRISTEKPISSSALRLLACAKPPPTPPPPPARAQAHSMGGECKPWHGRPHGALHQHTHALARARACTPILDRRLGTTGSRRGWCVCLPGQGNMPRRREVLVSRGGGVRACAHACAPASHPLRGWWWWWRWRWRRPAAAGRGPECRRLNGRDPTKPRRQAAPLGTR